MTEHDFSPHSDACVNCGLSRYDAEGVVCIPSTDDSAETCAEIKAIADAH